MAVCISKRYVILIGQGVIKKFRLVIVVIPVKVGYHGGILYSFRYQCVMKLIIFTEIISCFYVIETRATKGSNSNEETLYAFTKKLHDSQVRFRDS